MILRARVSAPPTFRPDHQVGRVLAYVENQLERRREFIQRAGTELAIEGVSGPRWNLRYTGRARVAFEDQPAPGSFAVEVSVLREAVWTGMAAPAALLLVWWNDGPLTGQELVWVAVWVLATSSLWLACGVYKLGLLSRLLRRGIAQAWGPRPTEALGGGQMAWKRK
jgi:hypothetical protein